MDAPTTPRKRKRSQRTNLLSRYFSTPPRSEKRDNTRTRHDGDVPHSPPQLELNQLVPHTKSRFFQPKLDLDAILADPAFLLFYHDFLAVFADLYYAKPILIQGMVSSSSSYVYVMLNDPR